MAAQWAHRTRRQQDEHKRERQRKHARGRRAHSADASETEEKQAFGWMGRERGTQSCEL